MARQFRTALSVEECVARLAATTWTGEAKPGRWQPTTADPDVFRKVEGHRFQLADRRMQANHPGEFYQALRGSLHEQAQGTLIAGSYGSTGSGVANLSARLLVGAPMMVAFVVIGLVNFLRGGDGAWPLLVLGLVGVLLFALAIAWVFSFQRAGGQDHEEQVVRALIRLLEAKEVSPQTETEIGS